MKQTLKNATYAFLLIILAGTGGREALALSQSRWYTDFNQAIAESRRVNKPVLVDVYAVWCTYCRKMRRTVYPTSDITRLRRNFISVRIDGEKNIPFMRRFNISGFPHTIFMDKNGYVLDRVSGFMDKKHLSFKLRKALVKKDLEKRLQAELKKDPRGVLSNYKVGLYYYGTRMFKDARRYFIRAWNVKSATLLKYRLDALYNAAISSMELRDYVAAIKHWNAYLRVIPRDSTDYIYARFYRGLAYRKMKKKARAIADLEYAEKNLPAGQERNALRRILKELKRG